MLNAPLAGITVIELARVLAGPWLGQTLADLGADVIKVEAPAGDETRQWGPPFIEHKGEQNAAYFHCCNRGKRSIVADLKTPDGQRCVQQLAAQADIFVQNFRVGALDKYGLDYATLAVTNPRLIYCSISGFGQDGPHAALPGYDFLVQATGGLMSVTGATDGEAQKVGVAFADLFTALYGAIGIQTALHERQNSGRGQHIDVSLLDSMVGVMANQAMNYLATGVAPQRLGNTHPNIAPYQSLPTADGTVIITVGNNGQFQSLCTLLKMGDTADDPRFSNNAARVKNRDALTALLTEKLEHWQRAAFVQAAQAVGVPVAAVNNMAETFTHPQVQHRKMQIAPEGVAGVRTPILFSGNALTSERASPALGEHSAEIKKQFNISE
ncbi:MAG: CoA transferase [Proteobacteria bacterium]|nr:CoA transferase [Pseudomonadota bacterium]